MALIKVLFEPKPKLVDSVTYDITAWSLPYAYGLNAYASKEKLRADKPEKAKVVNAETEYGYVMPWNGIQSGKDVGQLLKRCTASLC